MKYIDRNHIPTDRRPLGYWLRAIEGPLRENMRDAFATLRRDPPRMAHADHAARGPGDRRRHRGGAAAAPPPRARPGPRRGSPHPRAAARRVRAPRLGDRSTAAATR